MNTFPPGCHAIVAIEAQIAQMDSINTPELWVDRYPAARRSLRIAVVTETYPPEVNGVALTLARLLDGLHERNHEIQLIRPRQAQQTPVNMPVAFHEVLMRGLPIPRYPDLRMGVPSKRMLTKLWSEARPDVVHVATEGPLGWSALNAARYLRLPVSTDFRTNFHAYSRHYGIGWLRLPIMAYLRKFHNRAHSTTVPTEALRADLNASGFRRLTVIPRGVDTTLFSPAQRDPGLRAAWGVGPDDLVLCCVGRLAPEKNLELLMLAYESVRKVRPTSRLLIVGDGPLRPELTRRCTDAIFAGQQTGTRLAAHYASADLFAFPSMTETFGNVTIEALASGLPVLAFGYAAAAQVMNDGAEGRLVRPGDSAQFIAQLLAMTEDVSKLRMMGERARQTAIRHGWREIVLRFESLLLAVSQQAPLPRAQPGMVGDRSAA